MENASATLRCDPQILFSRTKLQFNRSAQGLSNVNEVTFPGYKLSFHKQRTMTEPGLLGQGGKK